MFLEFCSRIGHFRVKIHIVLIDHIRIADTVAAAPQRDVCRVAADSHRGDRLIDGIAVQCKGHSIGGDRSSGNYRQFKHCDKGAVQADYIPRGYCAKVTGKRKSIGVDEYVTIIGYVEFYVQAVVFPGGKPIRPEKHIVGDDPVSVAVSAACKRNRLRSAFIEGTGDLPQRNRHRARRHSVLIFCSGIQLYIKDSFGNALILYVCPRSNNFEVFCNADLISGVIILPDSASRDSPVIKHTAAGNLENSFDSGQRVLAFADD